MFLQNRRTRRRAGPVHLFLSDGGSLAVNASRRGLLCFHWNEFNLDPCVEGLGDSGERAERDPPSPRLRRVPGLIPPAHVRMTLTKAPPFQLRRTGRPNFKSFATSGPPACICFSPRLQTRGFSDTREKSSPLKRRATVSLLT